MEILLIDDESIVTDSIEDSLEMFAPNRKYGRKLKIDKANNFFDARKLLENQNNNYDLIISDLLMPRRGADIPDSYQGRSLTGWFFLYHHILKPDGQYHNKCKNTTVVIFSAYEWVWEEYIKENPIDSSINADKIIVVSKEDDFDDNDALVAELEKIFA